MTNPPSKRPELWKGLFFSSLVGFLFIVINFPKFATNIIETNVTNQELKSVLLYLILSVQNYLALLIGPSPAETFQNVMTINFILLWTFLVLLVFFSIRHLDGWFVAFGSGGIILGYLALHLISWLAVIVIAIIAAVTQAVTWISGLLTDIVVFIVLKGWWLILLLSLIGVVYLLKDKMVKILIGFSLFALVFFLLYKFLPIVWLWFANLVAPITKTIKAVWIEYILPILTVVLYVIFLLIKYATLLLGIILIFTTLGNFIIDQLKSAWYSGRGRKGVLIGGFSIGSAVSIVILTSVAAPVVADGVNVAWQRSFEVIDSYLGTEVAMTTGVQLTDLFIQSVPDAVRSFIFQYLTNIQPPIVDSVLLLAIVATAATALLVRIFPSKSKATTKIPVSFLPKEYLAIFAGLLVSLVLVFMQAVSESSSEE